MAARQREALFVCEDAPIEGLNGPATYNWTIANALLRLGYVVDLIVTSPRLTSLANSMAALPDVRSTVFLHGRQEGGKLRASSMPARLRLVKYWLEQAGVLERSSARRASARIGRAITDAECAAVRDAVADRRYDLIAIDTIFRAAALAAVPRPDKALLVAHDVFFERAASFKANGVTARSAFDRAGEIAAWRQFDAIAAISAAEAATIAALADVPTRAVLPSVPGPTRAPSVPDTRDILYIGTAAHHNVDGLRGFCDRVWPTVLADQPDAVLHVVGNIDIAFPTPYPNVRFHGRVDDVAALAAQARFAINPVWMGSGIKIKMVDYFRLGLPCVVTAVGAQGFPDTSPCPFLAVGDDAGFAAAIINWLEDLAQPARHAARISDYLENFSLDAATRSLAALIEA